jgi:transposase
LELFAQSLTGDDRVVMEVTGNAWEIARIIEPHVRRVIVVSPSDTGIRHARAKTDRLDARTLAKLLAAGTLDGVWMPDERARVMRRRLARRSQLVDARTRVKNEIHAILIRRLKGRPDVSDLFGKAGRAWLAELELPIEERETLDSGLRQIDFLDGEVACVDRVLAHDALNWPRVLRLMTVPGVNVIAASTFLAAVGNIERFPDRRKLVGYLGLDPQGPPVRGRARHARAHLQARLSGRSGRVGRGQLERRSPAGPVALVLASRSRPSRSPDRHHRHRPQARLPVLGAALAPAGLRLRPALADGQEDPPSGDHRRRAPLARPQRHLDRAPPAPPGRARPRPPSRTRLRADRPRPTGRRPDQGGRERDTGARITTAL